MMLTILEGDAMEQLRELPSKSVQCCVTSPPYWGLRDYGDNGQLGLEKTPEEYVRKMVEVFREVRRVLRKDGTMWLNLGDSYASAWSCNRQNIIGQGACVKSKRMARGVGRWGGGNASAKGLKEKDLIGIPWRVAFALQADGWWLRSDIIWAKPNPMPESVTDRPTKSHEYLFLLTKSASYFYDAAAIKECSITNDERRPYGSLGAWELDGRTVEQRHGGKPRNGANSLRGQGADRKSLNGAANREGRDMTEIGIGSSRNKRSVWTVATAPYPEAHFATYPPDLIKPCIMAGSRVGDMVLDPFAGSGTTGMVALELGRKAILIELNPKYVALIEQRCDVTMGLALA